MRNGKIGMSHETLYTLVTPTMAEELLDHNTHNRPLRPGLVEKYARDMRAGRWERNAQPLTIDWEGAIHNGQHRLFAVIEAGTPVELMLLTGLDPETVMTVDTGTSRSYGDYRQLTAGEDGQPLKNVTSYQAVLRLIHWYETRWPSVALSSGREGAATHHELDAISARYPAMSEAVNFIQAKGTPLRNIITPTTLAFVYGMAIATHPNEAGHWMQTMWNPEGAAANDPAVSLRARLTAAKLSGHRLDRTTVLCFAIKSWNAYARGETLAQYRWAIDEPIPAIYGTPQYTGKLAAQTLLKNKKAKAGTKSGVRKARKV